MKKPKTGGAVLPDHVRLIIRMHLWHVRNQFFSGRDAAAEMHRADRQSVYAARQLDYFTHALAAIDAALRAIDAPSPIPAVLAAVDLDQVPPDDRAAVTAALALVSPEEVDHDE
jgi:hypothetical protein